MTNIDIYDISPQKFEELAFDFLQKQNGLENLENFSSGSPDHGFDFSAKLKEAKKTTKVAIEAKHRKRLLREDLRKIALSANLIKIKFDGFILITSAKLNQDEQVYLEDLIRESGYTFIKIYQNITLETLTGAINPGALEEVIQRKQSEKKRLIYSVALVVATLLGFFQISFHICSQKRKSSMLA